MRVRISTPAPPGISNLRQLSMRTWRPKVLLKPLVTHTRSASRRTQTCPSPVDGSWPTTTPRLRLFGPATSPALGKVSTTTEPVSQLQPNAQRSLALTLTSSGSKLVTPTSKRLRSSQAKYGLPYPARNSSTTSALHSTGWVKALMRHLLSPSSGILHNTGKPPTHLSLMIIN